MGTVEKQCVICGASCAGEPRIKDADGRYAHKACAQKKQKAKQAPQAADDGSAGLGDALGLGGDDDSMAALLDDLPTAGAGEGGAVGGVRTGCVGCGSAIDEGTVVCMMCGTNQKSGKSAATSFKAPKQKKSRGGGAGSAAAGIGLKAGGMAIAPFLPVIGAVVGGAIGSFGWAVIATTTGYEVGLIATVVGALCGIGAAVGSGGNGGVWPGAVAVVVAVCAIFVGKIAVFELVMEEALAEVEAMEPYRVSDLTMGDRLEFIADEVVAERFEADEEIAWPASSYEEEYPEDGLRVRDLPTFYPQDIIDEANARYDAMDEPARAAFDQGVVDTWEANRRAFVASMRENAADVAGQGVIESLTFYDAIWGFLAIGAAWTIGSGGSED